MEQTQRKRTPLTVLLVSLAAVSACAVWYGVGALRHDTEAGAPPVAVVHGDDRLPSTTAADWVTYADHVLVVTPLSETASKPSKEDTARKEGVTDRLLQL